MIITMRILSFLAVSAAICCACAAPPAVAPVASPEPALSDTVPAAPGGSAVAATGEPISICVYRDGRITTMAATYHSATGDTLVDGRPFVEVHPVTSPPYVESAGWYIQHQPVTFGGALSARKTRDGPALVLNPGDVQQAGTHNGVPVFTEAGAANTAVIFFFVRPGCVFQAYQAMRPAGTIDDGR